MMTISASLVLRLVAPILAALAAASVSAYAQERTGTFVLVSDIHFDPFTSPELARALAASDVAGEAAAYGSAAATPFAQFGADTNAPLLASAIAAIANAGAATDFVIVPGDMLAHGFEKKAAALFGSDESSDRVRALAVETTLFVAKALRDALPGKPIIIALGNNDSECGDYQVEPDGNYLARIRETVRQLVGADLVDADFDNTFAHGGWYAARHPTVPNTRIFVLNDVLWSTKYRDACGADGSGTGDLMMTWLSQRLAHARSAGEHVWLVHHIPAGIDAYSTIRATASTCPAKVIPFLKEPFASQFVGLLRTYADIIRANLSGHVHFDGYRLITGARSHVVGVDKIAPAVSPIFGQNPAFQIFTYDRTSAVATDFSTWYLANLAKASPSIAADWRLEYTFTNAYAQPAYSSEAVAAIWRALSKDDAARDMYRRFYSVSRGELEPEALPAYACAIGHLDQRSFADCYCRD